MDEILEAEITISIPTIKQKEKIQNILRLSLI